MMQQLVSERGPAQLSNSVCQVGSQGSVRNGELEELWHCHQIQMRVLASSACHHLLAQLHLRCQLLMLKFNSEHLKGFWTGLELATNKVYLTQTST